MICNENVVDIAFLLRKMLRHLVIVVIFLQLLRYQFDTSQSKI